MYKQNLNTMKKIFGLVAVAAIAALNLCVAVNCYSSDLKKFFSGNESLANVYEYEDGTELVRGCWNTNWRKKRVKVTCNFTLLMGENYKVWMTKCGEGDGDCWFSDTCWTVD